MTFSDLLNAISKVHLLAPEDENELWSNFTAKNRAQLIIAYQPLVVGVLRRVAPSEAYIEDCLSEGLLALIKSVDKYKYDKGIAFSVFARLRIKGSIIDYLRKSVHDRLGVEETEFSLFGDLYDKNGLSELEQDRLTSILTKTDELCLIERSVIRMIYFEDVPREEIARKLGVSQARVSQIHAHAIKRIRGKIFSRKHTTSLHYVK